MQQVVREFCSRFTDDVKTDIHGNVLATVNPQGTRRVLVDAHCDQIGLLVKYIDDQGFLRVTNVGGWDMQILLGQKMLVHTDSGSIPGVIARKPIHLLTDDEKKSVPRISDLWIDIGCTDGEEARSLVTIGDTVTPTPSLTELRNGRISGVAMDDRTGVWVVMDAARRFAESIEGRGSDVCLIAVSSVQEEIGLRGARTSAYSADPEVAIAVDVTHATDCPGIDPNEFGKISLGGGPVVVRGPNVNPRVFSLLRSTAESCGIELQINGLGKPASNDAAAIQVSRGGVATGLVTLPNRYMHSPVEVVAEKDLDQAAELIAQFCGAIHADTDFTP